jgi:D-alanyl-D-alanine carboxypeptidase
MRRTTRLASAARRLLVLSALLLGSVLAPAAMASAGAWAAAITAATPDAALAAALDQVLDQTAADRAIPGVVLAVAIPDHGMWIGARGLVDRAQGVALTADTQFCIASISKMFVATVALQLVQEGWLSLEQTVEHWLPGMVPNGQRITVRQLLNHTSGLHEYLDEPFMRKVLADPGRVWTPQELVALAVGQSPYFAPGARGRWHYANTNYLLLGLIVEQVTHNPLVREVHQRVIDPLGLQRTFFTPEDTVGGTVMHGYEGRRDLSINLNYSFAWGVGNIISNAEDLGRFAQALFGGALLQPETLASMQTFTGSGGFWGARNLSYGLGVMQNVLPAQQPTLVRGHTGALAGYRTAVWYLPDRGTTLVAAINTMSADPNVVISKALDALRAHGIS